MTDINVKNIAKEDTTIDYTNFESAKIFYPRDWKKVNLPHDWAVEGTFMHDNSLGNQPAANGFLPTGIGFYRKELKYRKQTKGKKYPLSLMVFSGIARCG